MKTRFIQSIPFFRNWTNLTLSKFSYFFVEQKFIRNQYVFKSGDPLNSIYVVREGEFEVCRKKDMKRQEKMPEPKQTFTSDQLNIFNGRKLFEKPVRINHLMDQNSQSPFRNNNMSKKNFERMNIFSLSGPGVIIAEEDIIFKNSKFTKFTATSTVKCKSATGSLYAIKVSDIERETRTQVSILSNLKFICLSPLETILV